MNDSFQAGAAIGRISWLRRTMQSSESAFRTLPCGPLESASLPGWRVGSGRTWLVDGELSRSRRQPRRCRLLLLGSVSKSSYLTDAPASTSAGYCAFGSVGCREASLEGEVAAYDRSPARPCRAVYPHRFCRDFRTSGSRPASYRSRQAAVPLQSRSRQLMPLVHHLEGDSGGAGDLRQSQFLWL